MACRGLVNLPGKDGLPGLSPSSLVGGSRLGSFFLPGGELLPGSLLHSQQAGACRGLVVCTWWAAEPCFRPILQRRALTLWRGLPVSAH